MRLCHLLAAMAISAALGDAVEAAPRSIAVNLDTVETAYAQYRSRSVEQRPRYRQVVYRNWSPRRSVRMIRYPRPVRYVRPYPYYRPAPVVRYQYPYTYYGPAYGYYRPVRYYAGYGWPYYRRPYGGISIGIGF